MLDRTRRLHGILTTEQVNPGIVDEIYRFRKSLFVDMLGWDLPNVKSGREQDQFDTAETVHAALFGEGRLVSTFRAVRTDRPYLSKSLFPHLATDQAFPESADVWEISRFGVRPNSGPLAAKHNYALMFSFARSRQARALVALADLAYERFLWRLGVQTRRYGEPKAIGVSGSGQPIMAVAGEIPMAIQCGRRFEALAQLAQELEIVDEALVLGRQRVSA